MELDVKKCLGEMVVGLRPWFNLLSMIMLISLPKGLLLKDVFSVSESNSHPRLKDIFRSFHLNQKPIWLRLSSISEVENLQVGAIWYQVTCLKFLQKCMEHPCDLSWEGSGEKGVGKKVSGTISAVGWVERSDTHRKFSAML